MSTVSPVAPVLRRLAAVAMGVVLLGTSSGQVVRAAGGPWTGLYVDGSSLEPVSGGLQHLYSPPTDTFTVLPSPDGRSVITVNVGDWHLRFEDRDGADLAVGTYPSASVTGQNGYHGMLVSGPGGGCPQSWYSSFTIRELIWSGVDDIASLALDFSQVCHAGDPPLYGALRIASSLPIIGVASDPDPVTLASTTIGVPGAPTDITFTSIGHAPVTFGAASIDGNLRVDAEIVSDACSGETVAPGETCVISVRLTAVAPMFEEYAQLILPEDSPAGQRYILLEGTVTTETVTTMTVDPVRSFWPGNTYVSADITPRPTSGTVTFHYDDGHGTSGSFSTSGSFMPYLDLPAATAAALVPRGTYQWTATFEGQYAYLASTSAPITRRVGLDTTTTLTAASYPIQVGSTAVLRARTTGGGGVSLPAGTITIRNASNTIVGSGPVGGDTDTIEVNVPGLPIGSHQFEATYTSSEDGKTSDAGFRLGVSTGSIHEAWATAAPPAGNPAYPTQVAATSTGVFVAGRIYGALDGQTAVGQNDVYLARYSPDGELVWTRQFGTITDDWAHSLVISGGALYVAYGEGDRGSGPDYVPARAVVAKMTLDGDLVWRREELHPALEPVYLAATPDGGVALGVDLSPSTVAFPDRTILVRSYRPDGSTAWQDLITGAPNQVGARHAWAFGLAADNGGVTLTGERTTSDATNESFVRRYDLMGRHVWDRLLAPRDKEPRVASMAAGAGGIWLSGYSKFPLMDIPNAFPDYNNFVRGFGSTGAITYTAAYPASRIVDDCSSFVTVGPATPDPDTGAGYGASIARWSATGQPRWRFEESGSPTRNLEYRDVAVVGDRAYVLRGSYEWDPTVNVQALVAFDGIPAKTDCDKTAPKAKDIKNAFVADSTVSGGKPAVRFTWASSDVGSAVARYDVAMSTDSKAYVSVAPALAVANYTRALAPGHTYRLRVRPIDLAGNVGAWTYGTRFRVTAVQETSRAIRWTGSWHRGTSDRYWGGHVRYSSGLGAKASLTFTGRSFAWVGSVGGFRGIARVYVNGVAVKTINLYASSTVTRKVLFATRWSTARSRTVTIKMIGTPSRPRGEVDAFVTGS